MAAKPGARRKTLDAIGIDGICDMLRDGKSYEAIGKKLGFARTIVWKWVQQSEERSARAREALQESADAIDAEAERVLRTMKDVGRARELASHLRWRAKARNPKVYGDKQQVGLDDETLRALTEEQIDARLRGILLKRDDSGAGS